MKHWFLIQFKRNSYRLAERNLKRQGFETFLPMQKITRRKATRFVSDLRPLFPSYMFVNLDVEAAPWRKINNTIGVKHLLSFDGKPKSLPLQLVSALMSRCDASGKLLLPKTFNSGDSVKLLSGPFANYVATVERIDASQRVWILMQFMGQSTSIRLVTEQLQHYN
jgi:transcriptional antiterminator RfaH